MPLQPFGEVPQKMARQLERSLGAARTFTNALKSSTEILQAFMQACSLTFDCVSIMHIHT